MCWFSIVDRLKELIKYKGFQGEHRPRDPTLPFSSILTWYFSRCRTVPPADLEALLLTHPKVDDVGVIGIMSEEQATELPRAYIVPQGGLDKWQDGGARKRLEEEIVKWVGGQVANHKKLRGGVVFIDAIPKR